MCVWVCVCAKAWRENICPTDCTSVSVALFPLFMNICESESQCASTTTHSRHLTLYLRSVNHKNLVSGNNWVGPAAVLLAAWIDGRSIPAAGDNRSVSASTDPKSYLCLPTASMPQMTTGTCISLYCSKAQREGMCLSTELSQACVTTSFAEGFTSSALTPPCLLVGLICTVGVVWPLTVLVQVLLSNFYHFVFWHCLISIYFSCISSDIWCDLL